MPKLPVSSQNGGGDGGNSEQDRKRQRCRAHAWKRVAEVRWEVKPGLEDEGEGEVRRNHTPNDGPVTGLPLLCVYDRTKFRSSVAAHSGAPLYTFLHHVQHVQNSNMSQSSRASCRALHLKRAVRNIKAYAAAAAES